MAVLLRDATSTEGKGAASDFPKSITSAFCAVSRHGGAHWSSSCQFSEGKIWCPKELRCCELSWLPWKPWDAEGSGQLCPRGLHGARSLGHGSTHRDADTSIDRSPQLQGRSACSFLGLISGRIQPDPFKMSFEMSFLRTHICAVRQLLLALGCSLPQVGAVPMSCLPWRSGRGSSGSSNIPGRNLAGIWDSWLQYHTLLPAHSCSPVAQHDGASPTILLSSITIFFTNIISCVASVPGKAEKLQIWQFSVGFTRAQCPSGQDPASFCSVRCYFVAKSHPQCQGFTKLK